MGSAIGEACVHLAHPATENFHARIELLLSCTWVDEGEQGHLLIGALKAVNHGGVVPLLLVLLEGGLGSKSMLLGEHLKNGCALGVVLAVVSNIDRGLAFAVGASFLDGCPLFAGDALIFEFDTLGLEKEADSLGTALNVEVDKLGHLRFVWKD